MAASTQTACPFLRESLLEVGAFWSRRCGLTKQAELVRPAGV